MGKRRRRAKSEPQAPLPARPRCPWCGGGVLELIDGENRDYECQDGGHGWMKDLSEHRIVTSKTLGTIDVVKRMGVLDSNPLILAARRLVLLEEELVRWGTESAAWRAEAAAQRERDLDAYRAMKAADPTVCVDTPWGGA